MSCRKISLIQCISCHSVEFISCHSDEFISIVTPAKDVGSNSRSALALIGREAHVVVLRIREAFHRWKFPALCLAEYRLSPLENAFTHVYDNCEITSKNPKFRGTNKEQRDHCNK